LTLALCGAFFTAASAARAALADSSPLFPERGKHKKLVPKAMAGALSMQAFVGLASQLGPAVVNIVCTRLASEDDGKPASGQSGHGGGREQGAGVIINSRGFILTNNHVVEHAADIRVRLNDDRELPAQLIGRDERTDIALIKIDAGPTPLPWAELGDSDTVRIGEWVMAIGNPFGLDHSVTVGIVSAKGRREVQPGGQPGFFDFLQTDAPINPGNSGGPLINVRGEVIGINSAMNIMGSGIGFAIPSNLARAVADQLHHRGHVMRPWLGIYPQPVTETLRRAFGLPDRHGALLAEVYESSPASQAGLKAGDVIVDFDGRKVERADDLMWLLGITEQPSVTLRYYREGSPHNAVVMLKPETPPPPDATGPVRKPSSLGIAVAELTPQLAQKLGYTEERGLVILTVEAASPAMDAGVERGDIVLRVNEQPVTNLNDYVAAISRVFSGDIVRLLVRREDRKQWHNFWLAFVRR
jgi:serine protease Do